MKRLLALAAATLTTIVATVFAAWGTDGVPVGGVEDIVRSRTDVGTAAGITVGLVATPANEAAHTENLAGAVRQTKKQLQL